MPVISKNKLQNIKRNSIIVKNHARKLLITKGEGLTENKSPPNIISSRGKIIIAAKEYGRREYISTAKISLNLVPIEPFFRTKNNTKETRIERARVIPVKKNNLGKNDLITSSFLKNASDKKMEVINNLKMDNKKIREIKFLCSDCIMVLNVFTGISISPETVFQRSILNIFSLRNDLHLIQIIS
jgi:hypothetical protein